MNHTSLNDSDLTLLLRKGDHLAFAAIYERYKFILHAHALNKLRDRTEANDIIQEVFIYLWDKREAIEFKGQLAGYLYTAVRNAVINRIAHIGVKNKYIDSIKACKDNFKVETDHRIREKQLIQFIEDEIAQLPQKMREVFELSRKQHLTHKEIADKLELSEQTVSKQISNALKILKVKLGPLFNVMLFMI
ncbi:RNA polymerase sigma factor [Mucilaginibacter psychrotolerans]|uniref:RNA polymerase sigma-70 factor n=1 Tax=Mucilaginibacter psychrotolerans TaxID=1524096 RepID=A0A4Y8SFS3_9SPHI|nr:RNA polymerase sigma-70 factor [Mucilaginibacter psychrotolerans]TFF37758.1 RNA polymerase sigma-70 factor [Mucilaginibacter psychrotolerans]